MVVSEHSLAGRQGRLELRLRTLVAPQLAVRQPDRSPQPGVDQRLVAEFLIQRRQRAAEDVFIHQAQRQVRRVDPAHQRIEGGKGRGHLRV